MRVRKRRSASYPINDTKSEKVKRGSKKDGATVWRKRRWPDGSSMLCALHIIQYVYNVFLKLSSSSCVTCCRLVCDGEYGPPRSLRSRLSLCILVLRQVIYRLQKSLQSSFTFSSSSRWIRNTWIAFTIWDTHQKFIRNACAEPCTRFKALTVSAFQVCSIITKS